MNVIDDEQLMRAAFNAWWATTGETLADQHALQGRSLFGFEAGWRLGLSSQAAIGRHNGDHEPASDTRTR